MIDTKKCSCCGEEKTIDQFNKNKSRKDGYHGQCRTCRAIAKKIYRENNSEIVLKTIRSWKKLNRNKHNAQKARRRSAKLKATPVWADHFEIENVYLEAQYHGMHVDHIVPLQSDIVCGLHVWDNLQLLPPSKNSSKGNRYWPDMP